MKQVVLIECSDYLSFSWLFFSIIWTICVTNNIPEISLVLSTGIIHGNRGSPWGYCAFIFRLDFWNTQIAFTFSDQGLNDD